MSNERILDTLRAPHISEKAARLAEHNQYVFVVAPDGNQGRCPLRRWKGCSTSRSSRSTSSTPRAR